MNLSPLRTKTSSRILSARAKCAFFSCENVALHYFLTQEKEIVQLPDAEISDSEFSFFGTFMGGNGA